MNRVQPIALHRYVPYRLAMQSYACVQSHILIVETQFVASIPMLEFRANLVIGIIDSRQTLYGRLCDQCDILLNTLLTLCCTM
jgi:hypothetical protein